MKFSEMVRPDRVSLTVGGVVCIDGVAFMHPESFKAMYGESAYQHLLTLPRIVTGYDGDWIERQEAV